MTDSLPRAVAEVIRRRRTEKVLCLDVNHHAPVPSEIAERNRTKVTDAIRLAGWAPFHYSRNEGGIAEPWRAHVLWEDDTLKTAKYMLENVEGAKGEPALIAGCSILVLVTWLPRYYERSAAECPLQPSVKLSEYEVDEEHLAAASAMVQNLLLMLTAYGMGNYWSSGGKLRDKIMFDFLGIPTTERLLAAVFVEYPEMMDASKQRKPGKLREKRSEEWIRSIAL